MGEEASLEVQNGEARELLVGHVSEADTDNPAAKCQWRVVRASASPLV